MEQLIGNKLPNVPIRTFEMTPTINGPLEGGFDDWPAQIQDQIMEALEAKAQEVKLPLVVVYAQCKFDVGVEADKSDAKYYIHVVASEIVARDERYNNDAEMQKLHEAIVNGKPS